MKTTVVNTILDDQVSMRSILLSDIEFLRKCKNDHKDFFFYKNEITKEAQLSWFNEFMLKNDDHMFVIEHNGTLIGCIGVRLYQEFADIYNVILGNKAYLGKHIMTFAVEATVAFSNLIYPNVPVRVRVLRNNPAIKWYEKIGFKTIDYFEDHLMMQFYNEQMNNTYMFNIEIELPKK
jgi:RimJ/RimL family protein N-acetyltransferase